MLNALRKLFFGLDLTWVKIIVFAIVSGVGTGIIMMIPALEQTSIHNIGVTFEAWILFAMIICTNSKKPFEAAFKTLVFFLISQPLVYLTMWPVYQSFPWHYYSYWFYFTLATFPMALLAWYVRKQNVLSALIMTVVCGFLLLFVVYYFPTVAKNFPFGLLTVLFCIAQVVVYILVLFDHARERIIVGVLSVLIAIVFALTSIFGAPNISTGVELQNANQYTFAIEDESIVQVERVSEDWVTLKATGYGETVVTGVRADGSVVRYSVVVRDKSTVDVMPLNGDE